MYCIIDKIECVGSSMVYTEVGHTEDITLSDEINLGYDSTLGAWIKTNISGLEDGTTLISEFFDVTPLVHIARTTVSVHSNLPEINNVGEL